MTPEQFAHHWDHAIRQLHELNDNSIKAVNAIIGKNNTEWPGILEVLSHADQQLRDSGRLQDGLESGQEGL